MSDTTGPATEPTPPTEPLQLADQSPVYPAAEPAPQKRSHTRTILEVVGAAVAAFLILGAGVVGFAVGHATSNDRGDHFRSSIQGGPQADGQGFGQGQGQRGPGQGGGMMGGQDPRGIDPDGDNWTGGGMMGGQDPRGGMMGGQDPRGIDPDGDNWTGGGQG